MRFLALLPLVLSLQREGEPASERTGGLLGGLLPPAVGYSLPVAPRSPGAVMRAQAERSRRMGRVGHVLQAEIASVIRTGSIHGRQKIPPGVRELISVVEVDAAPDLGNARVKVSILGDRKAKISAMRWLNSNAKTIRHELAQRVKHMRRVPHIMFDHVDVGAATDIMVRLNDLKLEGQEKARARGDEWGALDNGIDFDASEDDAFDLDFDDDADAFEDEDDGDVDEELFDDDEDDSGEPYRTARQDRLFEAFGD
jgi:ribosome-binding factor A